MKVLVVVTQFVRLGGAERLQIDLAVALNRRGVTADVLSLYRDDLPGVPEARATLSQRGISRVLFLGLKPHPSIRQLLLAVWRLRRTILQGGYDIVEASGTTPAVVAILAAQGTRVSLVVGLHQVFRKDRDTSLSQRILARLAALDRRARYYAVSNVAASHWSDFAGVPLDRIRVVYNSISDEFFGPAIDAQSVRDDLEIASGDRLALYVGRLARYKGIVTLLEALLPILEPNRIVLAYLGGADVNVAGTSSDIELMRSMIERHGLTDRVRWLGHRTDVPNILGAADVLVHPTRMESFGLALVEALAAGVPVVSSDVEGIPEVLAGTDSVMVGPDDTAGLRQAVITVLDRSPGSRELARDRGRKRAEAFREARRMEEMVQLFEDRLQGSF